MRRLSITLIHVSIQNIIKFRVRYRSSWERRGITRPYWMCQWARDE